MSYAASFLGGVLAGIGLTFFVLAYVPETLNKIFNDTPEGK